MKKYLPLIAAVIFASAASLVTWSGCAAKIDQAGVYGSAGGSPFGTNDNSFLFFSDKTLVDSKNTLNAFVTWEFQNRTVLSTVAPTVTAVADTIRDNAPLWFTNAYTARAAYIAAFKGNPSLAGSASNAFAASVTQLSSQSLAAQSITNSVKLH